MKTNKGFYSALNNENRYSLQSFFCIGFYILPETNTKKGSSVRITLVLQTFVAKC